MEGQSTPVEERSDFCCFLYLKNLRYAWIHYLQEFNHFLLYFIAEFVSFEEIGKYIEQLLGHYAILVK